MKTIKLTRDQVVLVDDVDFEQLNQYKWYALWDSKLKSFYACRVDKNGKAILMHREIVNTPQHLHTDHRNRNTLDNQRCNLRHCSHSQNQANRAKKLQYNGKQTSSIYKGVSWDKEKNKWLARIGFQGKMKNLGRFCFESNAARAYDEAAERYFGEFARTNFNSALNKDDSIAV